MKIRCSNPMILTAGDKFILRTLSPSTTIAGGVVLTIRGKSRKKVHYSDIERLMKAKDFIINNDQFLTELFAGDLAVFNNSDLPFLTQCLNDQQLKEIISNRENERIIASISSSEWVVIDRICDLEEILKVTLGRYHQKKKYSLGMPMDQVCNVLGVDNNCADGLKKIFAKSNCIQVSKNSFALKDFKPGLSSNQQNLKDKISKSVIDSGNSAIARGNLSNRAKSNKL